MGLGVLDTRGHQHVPGTATLVEQRVESTSIHSALKRGSGRHSDVVLNPQPSDDPNDPLNWSYSKKVLIIVIIVYGACICVCCTGPLLNASLYVLSLELHRSFGDLALLSGYQILVAAASGPLVSALSTKYGKRPVLLGSTIACLIGTIVCSCASTYNTLLAGRIIQGLTLAAWESLPFTLIGDLFFVHERGLWTTVVAFTMTAISNLSSVIAGQIVVATEWRYLFHIMNGCLGLLILLQFFLVPETCYRRTHSGHPRSGQQEFAEKDMQGVETIQTENVGNNDQPPKKTFVQNLALFTGTYNEKSLVHLFLAPLVVCANLGALWTIIVTGMVSSFYVAMAYVTAQLFGPPPYLLTPAGIGNLSVGPFLGGTIGCVLVALMMDPLTLWMVKHNKGVFEPEFRLPLNIVGVLCGAGLIGFGALTSKQGNVYLIDFMWGLTLVGIVFITSPCSAYAIDAYTDLSNEIFILSIMFKNFLFYGYSYFVNNWVADAGPGVPFYVFAGISFGLVATALPVYMFGKRYRRFWYQHNMAKKFSVTATAQLEE